MRHERLKTRLLGLALAVACATAGEGCAHMPAGARLIHPQYAAESPANRPTPALAATAFFQPRTAPSPAGVLAKAE